MISLSCVRFLFVCCFVLCVLLHGQNILEMKPHVSTCRLLMHGRCHVLPPLTEFSDVALSWLTLCRWTVFTEVSTTRLCCTTCFTLCRWTVFFKKVSPTRPEDFFKIIGQEIRQLPTLLCNRKSQEVKRLHAANCGNLLGNGLCDRVLEHLERRARHESLNSNAYCTLKTLDLRDNHLCLTLAEPWARKMRGIFFFIHRQCILTQFTCLLSCCHVFFFFFFFFFFSLPCSQVCSSFHQTPYNVKVVHFFLFFALI